MIVNVGPLGTKLRAAFAISAVMLLSSCNPPPHWSLVIANNSDQQISFLSCRGERTTLAPGETGMLVDSMQGFHSIVDWGCYRKRQFLIETPQGASWAYLLWSNKREKGAGKDQMEFEEFSNAQPAQSVTRFPIRVNPDGAIQAGRWIKSGNDPFAGVEYPADTQPRGFPILPKPTGNNAH